jgi:iron complex outermembrane receptor protein
MFLSDRSSAGSRAGGQRRFWRSAAGVLAWLGVAWSAAASEPAGDDLTALSLEELGALSISAAAKRAQPLFETPAAVSVLFADDIRRYGHASLADALRLVPGVHVAGKNAFNWQVGIRGFNGLTSTKLLVTIDGRNIYSPYYAGVDWAEADLPVEDLARVEVVRGPGATLWGVNAVNGVINITSKSARDTQGGLLALRVGSTDASNVFARQGGALGAHAWYRVYARRVRTDEAIDARDGPGDVALQQFRSGLRVDAEHGARLRSTWQLDFVDQTNHPKLTDPASGRIDVAANRHRRTSALGRMQWRGSPANELTVQAYLDAAHDTSAGYPGLAGGSFRSAESGANQDLDVNHHVKLGERHDLVWGGGLRHTAIDVDAAATIAIREPRARVWRYNLFAQDEFALVPERWRLTFGTKLEHHDNVGWQWQPSIRLAWTPDARHTWWAAVSRAVRAPSRSETDSRLPLAYQPAGSLSPPVETDLVGTPASREEVLCAYELGWRFKPVTPFAFDATVYVHDYAQLRNLRSEVRLEFPPAVPGRPPVPSLVRNDLVLVNNLDAVGYGGEVEITWRPDDRWRFGLGWTQQNIHVGAAAEPTLLGSDFAQPASLASARLWHALPRDWEFSMAAYYTSRVSGTPLQAYVRLDAQLTWRPRPELELNCGIQNATDPAHPEFATVSSYPLAEVPRDLFARVQWRF